MKKFKKLLALLLAAIFCLSALAGCGSQKDKDSGDGSDDVTTPQASAEGDYSEIKEEKKYPEASELDPYKIGVILWGYTDVLGASVKKNLTYIGKEFNCEMIFSEALTPEDNMAAVENLIQSGVNGIVTLTCSAGMIEACDKAGVYLSVMLNEIADEPTRQAAAKSKYFCGMVTENDEQCGEAMVDSLYEQGCRNLVYCAPAPGYANHDNRVRGIEKAAEKYSDLNILTNYRGEDIAGAIQNFVVSFPEMDGLIVTGGATGGTESIYQIMQSEGIAGKVKFATFDIGEGTSEKLESGELSWIAGGQFPTTGIAFILMYNALVGTPINDDTASTVYRTFMVLKNKEEFDQYTKYVEGDIPPYTGQELKALVKKFNPDASLDLVNEYGANYSIQDVVERHKDLFK